MTHILPIYHALGEVGEVVRGSPRERREIHGLSGSVVHKHAAQVWHHVYPGAGGVGGDK